MCVVCIDDDVRDNVTGMVGNYGYFDQLMAIEWTYENIEAFGGDPNNMYAFIVYSLFHSFFSLSLFLTHTVTYILVNCVNCEYVHKMM